MSFIYLRDAEEVSSEVYCWDTDQCALLKSNPIAERCSCNDSGMESCRDSRSGTTLKISTESPGEDGLMSSAEGSPAKTYQQPDAEQESKGSAADCGESSQEWFAKWDRATSSWKTHQCLLLGDLEEFSGTWPQWGLMRDGECWEQQMLVQTIKGTESGLSECWPTPDANCGQRGTQPNWTPKRKSGQPAQYTINQAVRDRFPTPTAHNSKECNSPSEQSRNTPTLATHAGGKLNPMWVEWLMGWPLAWTDLKPLAMDKFRQWLRSHGVS